jgi:uncharacterized repeat protein (TIGR03806 family)
MAGLMAINKLPAQNYGVNFVGNTSDRVTGTAGVVTISNWNNIANGYTSGTILANDGLTTATLSMSGAGFSPGNGGWNSGSTADGANGSLMDGYVDVGSGIQGGASAIASISGLNGLRYNVYLYIYSDQSHPANSGDWLPNYSINGTTYYVPQLGNGTSTYNSTGTTVGGTFGGFVRATTYTANFGTETANASDFGNYIEIQNVAPTNGVITIAAEVDSSSWRSPLDGFELVSLTSFSPGPAVVTNNTATGIQARAATLNGTIVSVGTNTPIVNFYYGPSDGGTNAKAWSNSIVLGSEIGIFSATVGGLATNTSYFFTAQASNSAGVSWAIPSQHFVTLIPVPPVVTNLPATGVAANLAILNGQVLNAGNEPPASTVYYGTSDGGSNPAAWANQMSLGAQFGNFSVPVVGLMTNTTYYFTSSASNSAGSSWGGPSKSFTTLAVNPISVLTYHYDNTRQGANTNETLLTLQNVNTNSFGKLFTYNVDGYVYAQPLIMTNLAVAGKGVRNVVFVATMHDSVYAFDADSNGDTNGGLLWHTNLGISSPSPIPEYGTRYHTVGNLDVVPEEGMTGTPVIDPTTGTLYVDAFTREVQAGVSTNYFHRIHALNVTNGQEYSYSPVVVAGSVPGKSVSGNGTGTPKIQNGSNVVFSAIQQCQRPALTLVGGILYVAYGSHDDTDPYHGWVFGFNATNLALTTNYIFNTTPNATTNAFGSNAGEGAIWMSGNGLCVDANSNLFFMTGNGSFSANTNGGDYSDSFVKLSTVNKLAVADYFTPYNQLSLQNGDSDLGSGGALLLPDSVGSVAHPHLMIGAGKEGKIFLIDRDNMGHYDGTDGMNGSDTNDVEELPGAIGGAWCSPAYFNHLIFYQGNGDVMKAFLVTNGVIASTPVSKSSTSFGFPGATPTISANGTNNGIAWIIDPTPYLSSGPAVLHAYNATNLAIELYNSSQNLQRDNPGGAVKMVPPVIAGGKVYVGAEYAVSVFGNAVFMALPTIMPAGGPFTNSVTVTLADTTAGASLYYTLDGSAPSTGSTLYTGPFALTNSALLQVIAVAAGAVNSGVANASFVDSSELGNGIGLVGAYYTNHTSLNPFIGSPVLTQTNATINFNWSTNGPDPTVGKTNFTVRWLGSVQPQFSENYTFYTTADDGVRLYVNGQLLINDWVDKTNATTDSNSIPLIAQQLYNIELDYYQKTNNASVSLSWSSPSTIPAIIPQTQLYPYTNPPPAVIISSPTNNSTYTAAASVTIGVAADASYNEISTVAFYANGNLVGILSNSIYTPLYTLTTTGLAAGNYALTAVATDGSGLSSISAPVNITVNAGSGVPYGLTASGIVQPFLNMPATFNGALPPLLSGTGAFSDTTNRISNAGLIPYIPNTPLWSDGAVKSRYVALPNNGGVRTPDEQIGFLPTNSWTFPAGTVFVKNFDLVVNQTNTSVPLRRLETRLLVRDSNGAVYGVTYKWRADNSDADLLTSSLNENILITNATGVSTQTWYYPSPADCLTCHTPVAHYVLGVNARQLNGNLTYPATGITDNQLRTLNRMGLFNPAFDEAAITNFEQLSALTNASASLQQRARSYLDANCAQCHQPGGTGITFDARYDTPLAQQNITNYPAAVSLGYDNACIIKARDMWRSTIWQRINSTNSTIKMPPLARNLIDTNAVQVFSDWINSLPGMPALAPPVIAPNGGNYISSAGVTLSAQDPNAAIYYTLNGSLPGTNAFLYSGAFNLTSNATVSASAFETNFNNSITASAQFFVQPLAFTFIAFLPNQQLQMGFVGAIGSNYVLLATTNFTTWIPISTNTAQTNFFNLVDPKATNFPYRFYRVMQQ